MDVDVVLCNNCGTIWLEWEEEALITACPGCIDGDDQTVIESTCMQPGLLFVWGDEEEIF